MVLPVIAIVAMLIGGLLLSSYLGGVVVGALINKIINSIPFWGWLLILFFVLVLLMKKKK